MSRCFDLNRVEQPLGLDLREEHRARYEEVRARKEKSLIAQTRRETHPTEDDAGDAFCSLFELDDLWEFDPNDCGTLSRADLRDAFDWEDEAPLSRHESTRAYDADQLAELI